LKSETYALCKKEISIGNSAIYNKKAEKNYEFSIELVCKVQGMVLGGALFELFEIKTIKRIK
jgi:hypothetical protein